MKYFKSSIHSDALYDNHNESPLTFHCKCERITPNTSFAIYSLLKYDLWFFVPNILWLFVIATGYRAMVWDEAVLKVVVDVIQDIVSWTA